MTSNDGGDENTVTEQKLFGFKFLPLMALQNDASIIHLYIYSSTYNFQC